ncbi:M35 family metallo-endopeptidase [Pseudoduganella chitinolytica]|uniref:M35 family metallo-endopeptidase n=1 Tax=Pseudoduganella chitinolytica TaxID=34070 RepID=A0ABY8BFZ1_9BURK|nr:M35 family metallo-endopeptidase [Pseudoduganella chitinolytica]WEF34218.1 M35 family metallo-endopeptidase [Pseudoduganella chitinolytica]
MPIDWSKKFKPEYDAARAVIAQNGNYAPDWRPLVRELEELMSPTGFDAGKENALGKLRVKVTEGTGKAKVSEDRGILQGAAAWVEGDAGTLTAAAKKRAACLKLLRHVYLQNKAGNRKVWVVSLPTAITDWPSRYITAHGDTVGAAKTALASNNEIFSEEQKRYLGTSVQQALAWCQKAGIVLAQAASKGKDKATTDARAMVSRWFAEAGLADATLATYIADLGAGFKKIIAMLNKGNLVLTDWVPFRGTTDADEADFLAAEAFTFASNGEGMDVVYIESTFFTWAAGDILTGQANWTRIVVHELSHLVCGTADVKNGGDRYGSYGIGPHAGYPGSDCIRNADNWAFFAADCGGALTDAERASALTIK